MSNLIPTPRVNKNGVTVIKHMKPVAPPAAKTSIPQVAPTAPAKRTVSQRLVGLNKLMTHLGNREFYVSKARKWFTASSPDEIARLDFVLDNYETMAPRELNVVARALEPLANAKRTEFIHEIIALREAFCSEWSVENGASTQQLEDSIYGVREAFGLSLEEPQSLGFRDEDEIREAVAVVRFNYELDRRFPREAFRPSEHDYLPNSSGESYLRIREPDLVSLLREYPNKVEELIEVAAERRSADPQMLRAHLEHDGHTAVSGGYL